MMGDCSGILGRFGIDCDTMCAKLVMGAEGVSALWIRAGDITDDCTHKNHALLWSIVRQRSFSGTGTL